MDSFISNRSRPHRHRAAGFVLLDAVIALSLTLTLMITLAIMMGRQRRASTVLADTQLAHEKAEAALLTLRAGGTPAGASKQADNVPAVTLTRTTDPAAPGFAWVIAKATVGRATAEVYGMVPADAAPSPGGAK